MTRKGMKYVLSCVCLVVNSAQAQVELEAGQQYKPGTQVTSSGIGVSFDLPKDWLGAHREGGGQEVLMLGSHSIEGVGMAIFVKNQAAEQVVKLLNERQDLGNDVVLELDGAVTTQAGKASARYLNEIYVGRALAMIGPAKNHVIYFYAGPKKNEKLYTQLLSGLAASTKFAVARPPKSAPSTPPSAFAREWTRFLSGMMLKYLSSYHSGGGGGGMTSERVLHLCSDGRFAYSGSSSLDIYVPGATAGGGGSTRSTGQWRIADPMQNTAVLKLQIDGGGDQSLRISYDGEKTFIGNERWFRVESDACN